VTREAPHVPDYPKPFFRAPRGLWYVQIDGRQVNLGPDTDWHDLSPVDIRLARLSRIWTSLLEHIILAIFAPADSCHVVDAHRLQLSSEIS
jgi:hypothetical protein